MKDDALERLAESLKELPPDEVKHIIWIAEGMALANMTLKEA